MVPIIMPQIGQDIEAGRIVRWLKQENEAVEKGDVILVVESEKATFDVEADTTGVLLRILYKEGEDAKVLKPVGFIGSAGEQLPAKGPLDEDKQREGRQPLAKGPSPPAPESGEAQPPGYRREGAAQGDKIFVSPAARRIARQRGVSLEGIRGTGPGGRILKEDVLSAEERSAAPEERILPFSRMRQAIADRLGSSKRQIPHFYLFHDVDMEDTLEWRRSYNSQGKGKVSINDLVIHATARALREFEKLNSHVQKDRLIVKGRVNIGIATEVEGGILVPVIEDADKKDLLEISDEVKAKTAEAKKGKLDANAIASFTVTSLGMFGAQRFLPIINPPECGILGVGKVEPRVAALEGLIGVRNMVTLSVACDHRAVDGTYAARFMQRLGERLSGFGDEGPGTASQPRVS
jgi:pyruvate dehydrogenase E2 component (dihydrolipoamide acetyltransferase)